MVEPAAEVKSDFNAEESGEANFTRLDKWASNEVNAVFKAEGELSRAKNEEQRKAAEVKVNDTMTKLGERVGQFLQATPEQVIQALEPNNDSPADTGINGAMNEVIQRFKIFLEKEYDLPENMTVGQVSEKVREIEVKKELARTRGTRATKWLISILALVGSLGGTTYLFVRGLKEGTKKYADTKGQCFCQATKQISHLLKL
jgi:hypothetical protein